LIYRPQCLNLTFDNKSVSFLRLDGRMAVSFPTNEVYSIETGPTGHVLRHELIWITISAVSGSHKIGPFLLPNFTTQELDAAFKKLLKSAKGKDPNRSLIAVDLGSFQIGASALGAPPSQSDAFASAFAKSDVFEPKGLGIEIGTKDGLFDYALFTLSSFEGNFTRNGQSLAISEATEAQEIRELFGEPYWIDDSEEEIIYFYEYQLGSIELQFEFPDGRKLESITFCRNGVLSDPESRADYGVNKPWPPQ